MLGGGRLMMGFRIAIACISFSFSLIFSMIPIQPKLTPLIQTVDVRTQVAVTQQQVVSNAEKIAGLSKDVEYQRQTIEELREGVALQRGVGIGIGVVIGLLQLIQMFFQIKSPKSTTHHP